MRERIVSKMTVDRLRQFYVYATAWNMGEEDRPHMLDMREKLAGEFDTLLASVRREAAEAALREAAEALGKHRSGAGYGVWASGAGDWLRNRAAELRKEQS